MAALVNIPYRCPNCGDTATFSTLPELRAHLQTQHKFSLGRSRASRIFNDGAILERYQADARTIENNLRTRTEREMNNRKIKYNRNDMSETSRHPVSIKRAFRTAPLRATFRTFGHSGRLNRDLYHSEENITVDRAEHNSSKCVTCDKLCLSHKRRCCVHNSRGEMLEVKEGSVSIPREISLQTEPGITDRRKERLQPDVNHKHAEESRNRLADLTDPIDDSDDTSLPFNFTQAKEDQCISEILNMLSNKLLEERADQYTTANALYTVQKVLAGIEQASEQRAAQQQEILEALVSQVTDKESNSPSEICNESSREQLKPEDLTNFKLRNQRPIYNEEQSPLKPNDKYFKKSTKVPEVGRGQLPMGANKLVQGDNRILNRLLELEKLGQNKNDSSNFSRKIISDKECQDIDSKDNAANDQNVLGHNEDNQVKTEDYKTNNNSQKREVPVVNKTSQQPATERSRFLEDMETQVKVAVTDNDRLRAELKQAYRKLNKINTSLATSQHEQAEMLGEANALYRQADVGLSILKTLLQERAHQLDFVSSSLKLARTDTERLAREKEEWFHLFCERDASYKSLLMTSHSQANDKLLPASQQKIWQKDESHKLCKDAEEDRASFASTNRSPLILNGACFNKFETTEKKLTGSDKIKKAKEDARRAMASVKSRASQSCEASSVLEACVERLVERAVTAEAELQKLKSVLEWHRARPDVATMQEMDATNQPNKQFKSLPQDSKWCRTDQQPCPFRHHQTGIQDQTEKEPSQLLGLHLSQGIVQEDWKAQHLGHPRSSAVSKQSLQSHQCLACNPSKSINDVHEADHRETTQQHHKTRNINKRLTLGDEVEFGHLHVDSNGILWDLDTADWNKTVSPVRRSNHLLPIKNTHILEDDATDIDEELMDDTTEGKHQYKAHELENNQPVHTRSLHNSSDPRKAADFCGISRHGYNSGRYPKNSQLISVNADRQFIPPHYQDTHMDSATDPFSTSPLVKAIAVKKRIKELTSSATRLTDSNNKLASSDTPLTRSDTPLTSSDQSSLEADQATRSSQSKPVKAEVFSQDMFNDWSVSSYASLYQQCPQGLGQTQAAVILNDILSPDVIHDDILGPDVIHDDILGSDKIHDDILGPDVTCLDVCGPRCSSPQENITDLKVGHDNLDQVQADRFIKISNQALEKRAENQLHNGDPPSTHENVHFSDSSQDGDITAPGNFKAADQQLKKFEGTNTNLKSSGPLYHNKTAKVVSSVPSQHFEHSENFSPGSSEEVRNVAPGVLHKTDLSPNDHQDFESSKDLNDDQMNLTLLEGDLLNNQRFRKKQEELAIVNTIKDQGQPTSVDNINDQGWRTNVDNINDQGWSTSVDNINDQGDQTCIKAIKDQDVQTSVDSNTETDLEKMAKASPKKTHIRRKKSSNKRKLKFLKPITRTPLFISSSQESLISETEENSEAKKLKQATRRTRVALFLVFSFLDTRSLLGVSCVCKEWLRISRYPGLWKHVSLKHSAISSQFLMTLSQRCTKTQSLTLIDLKGRTIKPGESTEDYRRAIRGCLEPGLEIFLSSCQDSITSVHISQCEDILTDRCLWLVSGYCRLLKVLTYRSSSHAINPELMWALAGGCPGITSLFVQPIHPCEVKNAVNNKCLQLIGSMYPSMEELGLGGQEFDRAGLVPLAQSCQQLHTLLLDHCLPITLDLASAMCKVGLKQLQELTILGAQIEARAVQKFAENCRQLKLIHVGFKQSDIVSDSNLKKNQKIYQELCKDLENVKKNLGFGITLTLEIEPVTA